jgi:metal-dependent amidase/aminoacylase/carboxypeptidase family protein
MDPMNVDGLTERLVALRRGLSPRSIGLRADMDALPHSVRYRVQLAHTALPG